MSQGLQADIRGVHSPADHSLVWQRQQFPTLCANVSLGQDDLSGLLIITYMGDPKVVQVLLEPLNKWCFCITNLDVVN